MQTLLYKYLMSFGKLSLRYLAFAGALYVIFYLWKKREFFYLKIQQKYPDNKHILREVGYSFLSIAVFALVGTVLFTLRKHGYTKMYMNFADHSAAYFIFSVVAFILLHDMYFYFTHRLMHWKPIYPYVHKVHHLSTNPTPWAAFAFHPLEALIEVGIVPIMMFLIPLHPYAILVWVLYQTGMNVLGHLGFEIFPSGFTKGTLTQFSNTSVHHNMHHRYVTCNYGLYFNLWDRLLGTNHPQYHQQFEAIKTRNNQLDSIAEQETANSQLIQ